MDSSVNEILRAAESGDVNKIKNCVSLRDIDVQDEEGSTPLMYGAANGVEKMVRTLIQAGVNVDQQNHYGWTALLQAACYGHHEVVYTLLQNNANINLCNYWGTTPLVAAAQGGFTTVVQALLEKGAAATVMDEVLSITPLMAASQCGNDTIVKVLLDHGANPNTRYAPIGWTALMFATLNNHASVIKVLISRGAMTEMRNVNNHRAIDLASSLGLVEIVAMLSGEVTVAPSSDTDIFEAVKQDNVDMLTEVISKQKVSVTVTDKDGATPLMYAARKGNIKACQILLDYGADCDAQDQIHRWTAFMHAVHHGHYKIAKLLADYGANVNLRAKNGSSAFDIANLIGDTRTIHLIAEITIQRLTEKKEQPPFVNKEKEDKTSIQKSSPTTTQSPPPIPGDGEDNEVFNILRRVSNAYLASGSTNMPSRRDLARAGSHSPYNQRTPSPEPLPQINEDKNGLNKENDHPIPAVPTTTPPQPFTLSPLKQHVSPLSNVITPSPPILKVPDRPPSIGKLKKLSDNYSTTNKVASSHSSSGKQFPPRSKPNLRLTLSPFTDDSSRVTGSSKDPPHIKSPRSLPSDTFKLLKKPPTSTAATAGSPKGSNFLRSSSKYRLPPTFTSSTEKPRINGSDWTPLSHAPPGGEKSKHQFNLPPSSFDRIKLPSASKGLDLKTILSNSSLGHYYSKFEEEELDVNSFVTLSEQDLIELGMTDEEDRKRAMGIISQLKEQPPPRSPASSPKPYGFGSFKFQ